METDIQNSASGRLAVFVLVLLVLKFFFGWNISIIGSVVLTVGLSLVFGMMNRRLRCRRHPVCRRSLRWNSPTAAATRITNSPPSTAAWPQCMPVIRGSLLK